MKEYSPELQRKLTKALQVKAAHEHELFQLPGVHAVSVQPKTTQGVRTTEFAIVVYVVKKKSATELNRDDMVPVQIEGIPTDVVEMPLRVPSNGAPDMDRNHYPRLLGGAMIHSDDMEHVSINRGISQNGTLGCIAINQNTNDPSKKAVALTNAHVLLDVARTTTHDNAAVGQPDTSSLCCKSIDHTFGHIDQDVVLFGIDAATHPQPPQPTGMDAGFVTLDPEVQWSAEVIASGEGDSITTEQIAGAHPVGTNEALFDMSSGTAVPIYAVHKRGARTKATTGWLIAIDTTVHTPYKSLDEQVTKDLLLFNQLEIQPQDPTKFFAMHGDSGSVIVNSSHLVVGLLFGVPEDTDPPSSHATACPIADVQTKLGVTVADSAAFPGVQTVPKPSAAPHAFAELPAQPAVLRQRMEAARVELERTEIGREFDVALHRHFTEIRSLVNSNKRTAAVWRRIGGPAWIGEALQCLLDRRRIFPQQLQGKSFSDCWSQLTAILHRYGSVPLVEDLKKLGPELRAFAGRSYDELLAAWETQVAT